MPQGSIQSLLAMMKAPIFALALATAALTAPTAAVAHYADGMNLYQYVGSSPSFGLDPEGTKTYVSIYYKDSNQSFKRASDTWAREVKNRPQWDSHCDVVIQKEVSTTHGFITAWGDINTDVKNRIKKFPDDQRIPEMTLFIHASNKGRVAGLEFGDGTLEKKYIKSLVKLDWTDDGLIDLHGCYTGLTTGTLDKRYHAVHLGHNIYVGVGPRNYVLDLSVAEWFRDGQNVKTIGEMGASYFSESPTEYRPIDQDGNTSTDVYLGVYNRGYHNNLFGDGSAIPGKVFTK